MIIHVMDRKTESCGKCGGSLAVDRDHTGLYLQCLMCGRSSLINPGREMSLPQPNPVLNARWPAQAPRPHNPGPTDRKFPGESAMADKLLQAFRDLKTFYGDNPARLSSPEADYGVHWRLEGWDGAWRVSHVRNTGELYAVHKGPYRMGTLPAGETVISTGRSEGPVLVLGTFPADPHAGPADIWYRGLDTCLDGWARKCREPNGLAWLMDRIAQAGGGS